VAAMSLNALGQLLSIGGGEFLKPSDRCSCNALVAAP
jgi:hypothetical protein